MSQDYTIYHVVGKKVGCTNDINERRKAYPSEIVEILEIIPENLGPKYAGDREHAWADKYSYKRSQHYTRNWSSQLTSEQRSKYGKLGGLAGMASQMASGTHVNQRGLGGYQNMNPEQRSEAGKAGGKIGGKISSNHPDNPFNVLIRCLTHNKTGNLAVMKRWHSNCNIERVR